MTSCCGLTMFLMLLNSAVRELVFLKKFCRICQILSYVCIIMHLLGRVFLTV